MPRSRAALLSITPMIPSGGSLQDALDFYTGQMGFSILWQNSGMASIARDLIAFHIVENSSLEWSHNASFSIGVSDLDALYEEYRGISAKVGPLERKPWGRHEFHIIVPSGVCLQFYRKAD